MLRQPFGGRARLWLAQVLGCGWPPPRVLPEDGAGGGRSSALGSPSPRLRVSSGHLSSSGVESGLGGTDHNHPFLACFLLFGFSSCQVYSYNLCWEQLSALVAPLLLAQTTSRGPGTVIGPLQSVGLFLSSRSSERWLPWCFGKGHSAVPHRGARKEQGCTGQLSAPGSGGRGCASSEWRGSGTWKTLLKVKWTGFETSLLASEGHAFQLDLHLSKMQIPGPHSRTTKSCSQKVTRDCAFTRVTW